MNIFKKIKTDWTPVRKEIDTFSPFDVTYEQEEIQIKPSEVELAYLIESRLTVINRVRVNAYEIGSSTIRGEIEDDIRVSMLRYLYGDLLRPLEELKQRIFSRDRDGAYRKINAIIDLITKPDFKDEEE